MDGPAATPAPAKPALHQSQIVMFTNCGKQYEYRYVQGIKTPPGIALVTGTGTHKAVEENLRAKIATGKLLDEDQVTDVARDAVVQLFEGGEGVALTKEERAEGAGKVRAAVVDAAVALARLHHRELAPEIEPVNVERQFLLELPGRPVNLAGTIDIEEADGIRDTKTYAKRPSQDDVDRSIQLDLYGLAKRALDGTNPRRLSLDVLVKAKEPVVKVYQTTRTDADYRRLLARVDAVAAAIEKGVFLPTVPDDWRCSEKFCGYFLTVCPFGARQQVQVPVDGCKDQSGSATGSDVGKSSAKPAAPGIGTGGISVSATAEPSAP